MGSALTKGNKFAKLSSEKILQKLTVGNMSKQDAKLLAEVVEKRFPTPKK